MTPKELAKLRKTRMDLQAKVKQKMEAQSEIQKIKELREQLQPTARSKLKKFLTEIPSVTKVTKELSEGVKTFRKEIEKEKPTFVKKEKKRYGSLQSIG